MVLYRSLMVSSVGKKDESGKRGKLDQRGLRRLKDGLRIEWESAADHLVSVGSVSLKSNPAGN